ncbi:hypothetical protein PSACC_01193, partial [Paramicrosporidium saccamoebae]
DDERKKLFKLVTRFYLGIGAPSFTETDQFCNKVPEAFGNLAGRLQGASMGIKIRTLMFNSEYFSKWVTLSGFSTDLSKFLTWALVGQITSKESMQKIETLHTRCGMFAKELIMKFPLYEQLLQSLDPADCREGEKVAKQFVVGLIPELNGKYAEVANAIPDDEYVVDVNNALRTSDYLCAADGKCKDVNAYVEKLKADMQTTFRMTIGMNEKTLNKLLTSYRVPTEELGEARGSIYDVCTNIHGGTLEACIQEILNYKTAGDANKKPGRSPSAQPPATGAPNSPLNGAKAYWNDKISQDFRDLLRDKPFWTDEEADKAKTASATPDYVKSDGTSTGLGENDKVVLTYLLNNLPDDRDLRKDITEVASRTYIKSLGVKNDNVSGPGIISRKLFDKVKGLQGCPIEQRIRILILKNVDLAKEIIPGQDGISVECFLAWVYGCTTEEDVAHVMKLWKEERAKQFIKHFPFMWYLTRKFHLPQLNQSKSIVKGFFHKHDNKSYEKVIEAIPELELDPIVEKFYENMPECCTRENGCEAIDQYFKKLIDRMTQVVNIRICTFITDALMGNIFMTALPLSRTKRTALYAPIYASSLKPQRGTLNKCTTRVTLQHEDGLIHIPSQHPKNGLALSQGLYRQCSASRVRECNGDTKDSCGILERGWVCRLCATQ